MSFYRDTIRKSRKKRKCDLCNGAIKVGEHYHAKEGRDEDCFWSSNECEACQPVIDEYFKTHDYCDGYTEDWLNEWWRDVKCWTCTSAYLKCEPDQWCHEHFPKGAESPLECKERTVYGTCTAGDRCDNMTHYCRCENFKEATKTNG